MSAAGFETYISLIKVLCGRYPFVAITKLGERVCETPDVSSTVVQEEQACPRGHGARYISPYRLTQNEIESADKLVTLCNHQV